MDSYTLLQGIRNGDVKAFSELYDQYAKPLFYHVFDKTADEERSLEIIKSTFSTLYAELQQSKGSDLAEDLLTILADAQLNKQENDTLELRLGKIKKDISLASTAAPVPALALETEVQLKDTVNGYSFTPLDTLTSCESAAKTSLFEDNKQREAGDSRVFYAQSIMEKAPQQSITYNEAAHRFETVTPQPASPAETQNSIDKFFSAIESHESESAIKSKEQSEDIFGAVRIKRRGEGLRSKILTIILCVLLVIAVWFICGQLMYQGIIPTVDVGYSAFNKIFGWQF